MKKQKKYNNLGWSIWIKTKEGRRDIILGEEIFKTKQEAEEKLKTITNELFENKIIIENKGINTVRYESEVKEKLTKKDRIGYNDDSFLGVLVKFIGKRKNK